LGLGGNGGQPTGDAGENAARRRGEVGIGAAVVLGLGIMMAWMF
jgi:hypothetical protein